MAQGVVALLRHHGSHRRGGRRGPGARLTIPLQHQGQAGQGLDLKIPLTVAVRKERSLAKAATNEPGERSASPPKNLVSNLMSNHLKAVLVAFIGQQKPLSMLSMTSPRSIPTRPCLPEPGKGTLTCISLKLRGRFKASNMAISPQRHLEPLRMRSRSRPETLEAWDTGAGRTSRSHSVA